jgi:hypothetical protein
MHAGMQAAAHKRGTAYLLLWFQVQIQDNLIEVFLRRNALRRMLVCWWLPVLEERGFGVCQ